MYFFNNNNNNKIFKLFSKIMCHFHFNSIHIVRVACSYHRRGLAVPIYTRELGKPPHSVHTLTRTSDLSNGSIAQATYRTSYLQ